MSSFQNLSLTKIPIGKLFEVYYKKGHISGLSHSVLIKLLYFLSDEPATQSRGGYLTRPPGLVDLFYSILNQGVSVLAEYGEKVVGISTHFIYQRGG